MQTTHRIIYNNASRLKELSDQSVDLVVTSPPYPMIEMWDDVFSQQSKRVKDSLSKNDGPMAFRYMHRTLDHVWDEVFRVLTDGGIAAINIGDATRTINKQFSLYTNHSRILTYMQKLGFSALPAILWRKQTNAPNKFMGSGMMPPGAYVTLEHEYVLILRKGNKKEFKSNDEKSIRRQSSFFWEERNSWFSDVWTDIKGTTQNLFDPKVRKRSAAFPFELPYRIISMFSIKGDTVLDPFMGMGTTMYAAMAAGRNSIGYEIDTELKDAIESRLPGVVDFSNSRIHGRLKNHLEFVEKHFERKGKFKHFNKNYLFPVVTNQETELLINRLESLDAGSNSYSVDYSEAAQSEFIGFWDGYVLSADEKKQLKTRKSAAPTVATGQIKLFN